MTLPQAYKPLIFIAVLVAVVVAATVTEPPPQQSPHQPAFDNAG